MQKKDSVFQAFYDSELVPVLKSLENERKKSIILRLTFVIILGFVLWVLYLMNYLDVGAISISILVIALIVYVWSYIMKDNFTERFKEKMMGKMVPFVDESLSYNHQMGIRLAAFKKSKIFTDTVSRYTSKDQVIGKVGNTQIRFSQLHAEKSKILGKDSFRTIFRGIFFIAEFNKHFQGQTLVLSDVAENLLGSLGTVFQKLGKDGDKLIKLEDPEFEKKFVVYSTDPVEAHYILSPLFMNRIVDFTKKSKATQLSFIDSYVFIAIPFDKDLFEPSIYGTILDYDKLQTYNKILQIYKILQMLVGIVEDLNLNTRIWSKD